MPISHLTNNLMLNKDGILTSDTSFNINYPENGNLQYFPIEENSYWFLHRNDCIVYAVKRFPPKDTLLDIGGGNGFVAKRLLAEGISTAVLEPGKTGAHIAKTIRDIPEVINTTFEAASFNDEVLAALGLFDVLEHIEDDAAFLNLIWQKLIPGGFLYLTVPAHPFLWSYSDIKANHFRRYHLNMLKEKIKDDFDVRFATHLFSILTLPTLLFRVLPYKLMPQKQRRVLSDEIEHGTKKGLLPDLITRSLHSELRHIKAGKQIQFGTSLLMVLEKT